MRSAGNFLCRMIEKVIMHHIQFRAAVSFNIFQKGPLVRIGRTGFRIDKNRIVLHHGLALKRKGDEVAKAVLWDGILIWKQTVKGDFFIKLRESEGPSDEFQRDLAAFVAGIWTVKEDPDMATPAFTVTLQPRRYSGFSSFRDI